MSPIDQSIIEIATSVPGLGPIRIRSLIKAGFGTIDALRSATVEQLAAVPGISEAKARHIAESLAEVQVAVGDVDCGASSAADAIAPDDVAASVLDEPVTPPEPSSVAACADSAEVLCAAAALAVSVRAADLLKPWRSVDLRKRLRRQLEAWAAFRPGERGIDGGGKARRRLIRLAGQLEDAVTKGSMSRKRQAELADDLRATREQVRCTAEAGDATLDGEV